ncbi:amidohydrolase [Aliiglaciecola lipolytica]|uniref:Amidohydrolase 3 domain-containing protein n=1 Tax=Aliiglaciecola lipolytica E3 TaxID=1127673 RepID=K6X026_9ALTE|nr:amidohydrolase [Aliiglaciecola lipolytica]GAC14024.1 hypothetical protein GLIP_1383 [Aliiglaciecola lipolytica E3]
MKPLNVKMFRVVKLCSLILSVVLIGVGCSKQVDTNEATVVPILFKNGNIVTMVGSTPNYVEALVIDKETIVFAGGLAKANAQFAGANVIDLNGKTLLPAFIDPHSHIGMVASALGQANLSAPPVGSVKSFDDIIDALQAYKKEFNIGAGEWIFAWGYDENQLAEKRHITKRELDAVFTDNPVYLQHTSGHMGVANSQALALLNVDSNTPDPQGGKIVRFAGTNEPTGLVQEVAMYEFARKAIETFAPQKEALFPRAQQYYLSHGITTAQDGNTDPQSMALFIKMAQETGLDIDIVSLPGTHSIKDSEYAFNEYIDGVKFQGIKIVADGSPQGKTAFFSQPYLTEVEGCETDCKGLPSISQDNLNALFVKGYQHNRQLFIHSNGDASIDMIIAAHEYASKALDQSIDKDRRTIVIHSQFVRQDQLDTFVKYNILPSFFTNHAYFWGDVHVKNLGEARAHYLSPMKDAMAKGLIVTNHSDDTVTPIDPMFGLYTAVNRLSRSGNVIGEAQRVSPYQALKAITANAAYQLFEEDTKGTLEQGKQANLVILNDNPLTVDPLTLKDIVVMKTVKAGQTVYEKE